MRKSTAALAATASLACALMFAASPAAYAEEIEIPVTPIGVELADECGTMNDGFFFPDPEVGVLRYDIQGGFGAGYTVTAVLEQGYVLAEEAEGIWEFDALTDVACGEATVPTDPADVGTPEAPAQPAAVAEPTEASSSTLAETGFDGGVAGIAAAALLLGGALAGGLRFTRRRVAE